MSASLGVGLFEAASELVDDGEFIGGDVGHEIALDGLGDRAEEYEALFDRQLFDGLLEFGDLHPTFRYLRRNKNN